MRTYLAAIVLLMAWDAYATDLLVNQWQVAYEANPAMIGAVAAGPWAVALGKLPGLAALVALGIVGRGNRWARFTFRFALATYAALGFWHCHMILSLT